MAVPPGELAGGVAVVTGGAGAGAGLGQGLVRRFAAEGMRVAILDLDGEAAAALTTDLRDAGNEAMYCVVDVTDTGSLLDAARVVRERWGACNVLCAHVGGGGHGRFEDLDEAVWLDALQRMVLGTVRTVHAFLPLMRETSGLRRIVLTSSIAALVPGRYQGPYRASKAAVTSIGETLDLELGPEGIGTTIAFPSGMLTGEMLGMARSLSGTSSEDLQEMVGDPVFAVIAEEMARHPLDVTTGDDAAQPIIDAVVAGQHYVITHGVSVERDTRARNAQLDAALEHLAARGGTTGTTGTR
jgi:NAD(P)-dependent dehydrogenase (short-subunit alcohol dehydrogenase family)